MTISNTYVRYKENIRQPLLLHKVLADSIMRNTYGAADC